MATYLKPTSKLFDLPSRASADLNIADLMCPVCRGILIEPVTLPCTHSLCLRCLNGTIQHNSLSCPLCRVRVGSWLRTATKSNTLVNDALWKLIKSKFSKEIQAKHDGEETDLDSGFVTTTTKILSAAGEIRREYEAQLQLAEEERRRRQEVERIASEALIRKIQAEECQHINQLAKDRAVAKNLAKRHLRDKAKVKEKYAEDRETQQGSASDLGFEGETLKGEPEKNEFMKLKESAEWNSNIALISKLRAERYATDMKSDVSSGYKCTSATFQSQTIDDTQNPENKAAKHRMLSKLAPLSTQSYMAKPSCSNSKIYGTRSEEELHVPSDVLNRRKKTLGVEVCLAPGKDDRRIGSAESSGSHDSINIEIHHFKPIKAMPRTPLRTMPDGRQLDPKLIRVVAILKRVQNAVSKPPTPMQLKRLSVCSYSAFKGRSKKILKPEQRLAVPCLPKEELEIKPSTSNSQSQFQTNQSKLGKSQISETVRRLDLSAEIPYNGNKNYPKNINRIINGTKVSKRLILDEDLEPTSINKTANEENPVKFKRRKRNSFSDNCNEELDADHKPNLSDVEEFNSNCSADNIESSNDGQLMKSYNAAVPAVENIAERIKKRKMSRGKSHKNSMTQKRSAVTATRKSIHVEDSRAETETSTTPKKSNSTRLDSQPRKERHNELNDGRDNNEYKEENEDEDADSSDENFDSQGESMQELGANKPPIESRRVVDGVAVVNGLVFTNSSTRRTTRNSAKSNNGVDNRKKIAVASPVKLTRQLTCQKIAEKCSEIDEVDPEDDDEEDETVREQKRIERLVIQERKDFELAQRLQAKFDEMERISGRTRGSRRGAQRGGAGAGVNSKNIEQVLSGDDVGIRNRFAERLIIQEKDNSDAENNKRRVTRRRCVK